MILSKRPGRIRASSNASTLLVAPMTSTYTRGRESIIRKPFQACVRLLVECHTLPQVFTTQDKLVD